MQYVQLVVPKHLYDQLGLQTNQTITLHNSQSVSELKTHENNANTSNSSDNNRTFLAKPESDDKTVDGDAYSSSLKKPTGTFRVIHVNAGNTPNPGMTATSSNSQISSEDDSDSSDDEDVSTGEVHAEDCDTPILNEPENSSVDMEEADQYSFGNSPTLQKMTINGLGRQVISFSKRCEKCSQSFSSHASFEFHKKTCGAVKKRPVCPPTRKPISYPRVCPACYRCYANRSSYAHHQKLCAVFKKKQTLSYLQKVIQPLSSTNARTLGTRRIDGSSSNNSGDLDTSANESQGLYAEEKPEKWIPVTNNFVHKQKFFVVKKK